ncbi:MAG: helicase-exonuclease AddAB subunit AddA [Ruminococcaceae bacterium]|nr:helicase-exonuclease AddAB subunit AddA [Oscillospiraceae bacterium]
MAFKPTPQQDAAIYCSSGTLVSAAAGSGKTAVLVERVIDKLCGKNPISADRILVVTFTKAAAEEMRGRIEKRLNEVFAADPENPFLIEQKIKLRNAKICTIDSFCIDLVRENFDRLGISPDFSIADDAVLLPLSRDAMSVVINEAFEEDSDEFSKLLRYVSSDFDEGDLIKHIKTIYEFSQNMPFPESWLKGLCERSLSPNFFNSLIDSAFSYAGELLKTYANNLDSAINLLIPIEKVFDKYHPVLSQCADDLRIIAKYCDLKDWNKVYELVNTFSSDKLSTPAGFANNPIVCSARDIRNSAKEAVAELSNLFSDNETVLKKDFEESYKLINSLLGLTIRYMEVYEAKRKEKNVMTFADTTHAALSLLCKETDGEIVKTEFANEIISRFDEVLVDEFQDTNDMQDLLFRLLSDDEKNIFVVGDIKQSIYRFRGANPKNFMLKKQKYEKCTDENKFTKDLKKIILSSNFRSRSDICDFVNLIFTAVMNGKLSTVKYDSEELLNPEAKYPEIAENSVSIKITDVKNATEKWEAEANAIADYIEKVMSEEKVFDDKTKQLRDIKYSDFTVLFRSIKNAGPAYAEVLKSRGIPVSMQKSDFIETTEIQTVFSFLQVIENPTLDIPLAAVMMSPVFRFTADEIAKIRINSKNTNLISAVANFAVAGDEKCNEFLTMLKRLRNLYSTASISETITYIFNETDLLNIMSVLNGGERRRKNLQLLLSLATQYDANDFSKRSEQFLNHIMQIAEKGISSSVSAGDSVTLMTIHASKGLQFPICILADAATHFNSKDSSDKLLINAELGVSFKVNDDDAGKQKSLITRNIISVAAKQDQLDEEMRLLYVALTRAKEKLLICITGKDVLKHAYSYATPVLSAKNMDEYRENIAEITSFADMIWFTLMADDTMQKYIIEDNAPHNVFTNGVYDFTYSVFTKTVNEDNEILPEDISDRDFDHEMSAALQKNINYKYPFEDLKDIESKAAVAVIAHKAEEKDFSFTSRPAFMYKNGLTPAGRGTATHRFMQFADFQKAKNDIEAEIERLYEWEFITLNEKEAIDLSVVKHFFESDLFARMEKSTKVSREMRFLTEVSAGELNPELDTSIFNENVVVQGSVDCVFVEEDGIVVVDFKTDRVNDEKSLVDTYAKQLEIYATACEKIFRLPIKEKVIYSFHLSKEISF